MKTELAADLIQFSKVLETKKEEFIIIKQRVYDEMKSICFVINDKHSFDRTISFNFVNKYKNQQVIDFEKQTNDEIAELFREFFDKSERILEKKQKFLDSYEVMKVAE